MAGSYPDVPGRRMAYHDDGSVGVQYKEGEPVVEFTAIDLAELNDEDNVGVAAAGAGEVNRAVFIFPELREFDGIFIGRMQSPGNIEVQESDDTTNGYDGTWATVIAAYNDHDGGSTFATYRSTIVSTAVSATRAVKLLADQWDPAGVSDWRLQAVHIYGEITPGQTPDRLLWIDEVTGLEFTSDLDYGDVPRGSSEDRQLRLKNNSATLDADNIQYTAADLYLDAAGWFTFTEPGGSTFLATRQIASLVAGVTTGIITVRRITPGTALGLFAAYFQATTEAWV